MSRMKHKPFELVEADGYGLSFYDSIEEASFQARCCCCWNLRWGWSIWKINQDGGGRKLWVQSYTHDFDEQCNEQLLYFIHLKIRNVAERDHF